MAAVDGSADPVAPKAPAARSVRTPVPTGAMTEQQFATLVFNDIQSFWSREFAKAGTAYQPAQLVTFSSGVETGCGAHPSEVGPFYCPPDHPVYIDLSFLTALQQYIGAEGDFARAYIIAHELGHHVQTLLGVTTRVNALSTVSPQNANPLSVRAELQADCLGGVWASTHTLPEPDRDGPDRRGPASGGRRRGRLSATARRSGDGRRRLDARLVCAAPALAADGNRSGPPGRVRYVHVGVGVSGAGLG